MSEDCGWTEVAERPAQQRGAGRTPTSKWRGVTPVQVRGATEAGLRTAPQIQGLLGGRKPKRGSTAQLPC